MFVLRMSSLPFREMCADRMPPKAYIDGRLRRCQVKDQDVCRES